MSKFIISLLSIFLASVSFAGEVEIISLLDVQGDGKPELLIGASESQLKQYLPAGKMPSQILAYFVKVNNQGILFDTGLNDGHIVKELAKNNIKPEDVKIIMLTHLHPDHFGGLIDKQEKPVFPNATIYISEIERDYWVNDKRDEKVLTALEPYSEQIDFFKFGDEVIKGVKALDASGHTPGHTVFEVGNKEKILIVGDIMHFPEIQLPCPNISVKYDTDPDKARESRIKILDYAAKNNLTIAGMHITPPGICKIIKSGSGYEKK